MSDFQAMLLALTLYKIASIAVGGAFAYFGYRLFLAGHLESAGSLRAEGTTVKLSLTKGAPGTFFALFGTGVIIAAMWKGIQVDDSAGDNAHTPTLEPKSSPSSYSLEATDELAR